MEKQIIMIYCMCDDIIKALNIKEDIQVKMTMAEILTTFFTAASFFGGNIELGRMQMKLMKNVNNMLSKSQFNRRLRAIPLEVFQSMQLVMSKTFIGACKSKEFIVDSFPVNVCKNIRIGRCKIYRKEKYRGYNASKREYLYGIKVHMITTKNREPVDFLFSPASMNDCKAFKSFELDLPEGSTLYGDCAYTDYSYEEIVQKATKIYLKFARKSNSKKKHTPWVEYLINTTRKGIETAFSQINLLIPKKIHATTNYGFELKVLGFILAYSFKCLMVTT